jgi:hypothetical protein
MDTSRPFFPFEMERRLLKEILLDQRAVFEMKRPGTRTTWVH